MSLPSFIQKTLVMKPEVTKIFDDLDEWRDYCRFNLLKFDEKDLYKSKEYKEWHRERSKIARQSKRAKQDEQSSNHVVH